MDIYVPIEPETEEQKSQSQKAGVRFADEIEDKPTSGFEVPRAEQTIDQVADQAP